MLVVAVEAFLVFVRLCVSMCVCVFVCVRLGGSMSSSAFMVFFSEVSFGASRGLSVGTCVA